jgi:hypothetical protein
MSTQVQNNGKKMPRQGEVQGVIHIAQPGQLANEFITDAKSFSEALAKGTLRDEQQRNDIMVYKSQLSLFDMTKEIQELTEWLIGSNAIGGFNRSIAAMVGTNIYVPEGAGIQISKENQKAIMELQKERAMSGRLNRNEGEQQQ